ncbi:unknown [Roseburia sp. CAG:380]|nr:unknown [Roseburia sp. CAG:380]
MDTHNAYRIHSLIRQGRFTEINLGFLHALNVTHKRKYAVITFTRIFQRALQKQIQICRTLLPGRHRRHNIVIARFPVNLLQQIIHRKHSGSLTVLCDHVPKIGHLLFRCIRQRIPHQRIIIIDPLLIHADLRKFIVRKTAQHRTKHCCQWNVLSRIIKNPQEIKDQLHLHRAEISGLRFTVRWNSHARQHLNIFVRYSGRTPQQNDNIPVAHRTVAVIVKNIKRIPALHHLTDLLTDDRDLHRIPVQKAFILLDQKHLALLRRSVFILRKCRTRHKACRLIVNDAPQTFLHHLIKQEIRRSKHHFPASEVLVKIDPLSHFLVTPVSLIFAVKQLRSRLTEPVNTLLHITHHKQIRAHALLRPADTGQKCLLNITAVLILVDHDFLIILLQLLRNLARRIIMLMIHKDLQRKMLHIIKVKNTLISFPRRKCLYKPSCRLHQTSHGRCHMMKLLPQLF